MKRRLVTFFQLLPVVLSSFFIGAHFVRGGHLPLSMALGLILILMGCLFIKHPWVARIAQVIMVLSTLEWIRTCVERVSSRSELGQPWLRLALILGGVASLSLGAIFVFRTKTLRARYKLDGGSSDSVRP